MKLSEIPYIELLTKYNSRDSLEEVVFDTQYPKVENKTDFGIVFGGVSMIPYRIEEALKLYNDDLIDKLVLTGGIGYLNKDRKTPEAFKMREFLLKHNVPDSDIIVESKSRSTFENINLFLQILKEQYNIDDTSLALITSDFHLRRCLAMIRKLLNNDTLLYGSGAKDNITDIDSWYKSVYGRRMILKEALILCYYAKNRTIDDIEINLKR